MAVKKEPVSKEAAVDYARIAESIGQMSDAARAMRTSGLSRQAVVVLLKHVTGIPMADIKKVLDAAESLRSWCLTR